MTAATKRNGSPWKTFGTISIAKHPMNCQTFRQFLDESENAARVQDLSRPLQEHVRACSSCQKEWHLQQRLLATLEREPGAAPSPSFTAQVMARLPAMPLPAAPLKKRRFDFDTLLFLALLPAALAGLWYAAKVSGLRFIPGATLEAFYDLAVKLGRDFVRLTFGTVLEGMAQAFGQEMMAQALQVIFISAVTLLVAKSAVLIEKRIRRLFHG